MKVIKSLVIAVFATALLSSAALAETCCQKAIAAGKECKRKCCLAAHRDGKSCDRCNPSQQDAKLVTKKEKKTNPKS